jgi:hypothetical protein
MLKVARVLGFWPIEGDKYDMFGAVAGPELVVDGHRISSASDDG